MIQGKPGRLGLKRSDDGAAYLQRGQVDQDLRLKDSHRHGGRRRTLLSAAHGNRGVSRGKDNHETVVSEENGHRSVRLIIWRFRCLNCRYKFKAYTPVEEYDNCERCVRCRSKRIIKQKELRSGQERFCNKPHTSAVPIRP